MAGPELSGYGRPRPCCRPIAGDDPWAGGLSFLGAGAPPAHTYDTYTAVKSVQRAAESPPQLGLVYGLLRVRKTPAAVPEGWGNQRNAAAGGLRDRVGLPIHIENRGRRLAYEFMQIRSGGGGLHVQRPSRASVEPAPATAPPALLRGSMPHQQASVTICNSNRQTKPLHLT